MFSVHTIEDHYRSKGAHVSAPLPRECPLGVLVEAFLRFAQRNPGLQAIMLFPGTGPVFQVITARE